LKKSISIDFFSLLEPLGTQASLISFVVQENKVLCIKRKVPLSGHFGSRSDSGTMIQFFDLGAAHAFFGCFPLMR